MYKATQDAGATGEEPNADANAGAADSNTQDATFEEVK